VDVFLVLGAAVVKSALKIWLRDESFASDASASVVDLLQAKMSGDLEQRRARRFFEDLEVPVSKRLRAMRQAEFSQLPENEWTAAVHAAGDSFDRARLTAKDLFTRDLDPLFLERQIRRGSGTDTRDLSAAGVALYDRLISEGCAQVIKIADKLPHFQVGAFAELLHRSSQMVELIGEALDRIPARAEGESPEAKFETNYRRHLAKKMDRLELFGLDFESPSQPLSVAYVSLRTGGQGSGGGQSIEDRLASPRTLLVGRAGSGKTTVLQWLAMQAALKDFTGPLAGLKDYVPFFIRLREYVAKALPRPEDFIAGFAPMLAPPPDWARARLDSGLALVLVDGVDELPAERARQTDANSTTRDDVYEWLRDLVDVFPDARYVVTARPAAVSENWLNELSFAEASLEAMPPWLVETFVGHWHDAIRDQLADIDERRRLDSYERSLLTAIADDRNLSDLADTPLLAGLLCALNRHLRSQLPKRRSEIYERALAMFDQRDRARNIAVSRADLDLAAKTHLLADLALWMMRNGASEVDAGKATAQISRSLTQISASGQYDDRAVFRVLLERSGLLREPTAGRVDFVHRTFQEFLAAKAAVDADAMLELVRNSDVGAHVIEQGCCSRN